MALVSYTQPDSGKVKFTMNKNEVLAIPKVMADPIFSSESNWFRVSFVFKHTTSNKRFVPSFKSFSGTKNLRIRNGMAVDDQFELKKIIISKSDRSHLVIKTNEIPSVAGYQFSLSSEGQQTDEGGGGGGTTTDSNAIIWHNVDPSYYVTGNDGFIKKLAEGGSAVTNETAFSGPFELTYTFDNQESPYLPNPIGFSTNSGSSFKNFPEFAVIVSFEGIPGLMMHVSQLGAGSGSYLESYGFSSISVGLNTITFKMDASGNVSIVLNGDERSLSINMPVSEQYYAGVSLAYPEAKIESASLVIG